MRGGVRVGVWSDSGEECGEVKCAVVRSCVVWWAELCVRMDSVQACLNLVLCGQLMCASWPQRKVAGHRRLRCVSYVCPSSPQLSSPSSPFPTNRVLLSSSSSLNPLTRLSNQRHTNQWRHCLCCLCWPTSGWDTSLPFTPKPTDVFPHACCTLTCAPSSTHCTISYSVLPELTCTVELDGVMTH